MTKLMSIIVGGALGLTLAASVGVGVVVGSNNEFKETKAASTPYAQAIFNATNNQSSVSAYNKTWNNITNNFTWNLANFNNNKNGWDYVKCGSKNNASVATIQTSASVGVIINRVTITIDAITAASVNSITLYGGSSASTSLGTFSKSTGVQSITIANPSANQKYKISFDCKKGSSNGLVTLSNVSLYEKSNETFSVTYNGNGADSGSVPTDATSYADGASVTVADNTGNLVKNGYSFGGWNTSADGTGTNYSAGDTFSISANTTLYANWVAGRYDFTGDKLTFSQQGLVNAQEYAGTFTNNSSFSVNFTGGSTNTKYYNLGLGMRIYRNNGAININALNNKTITGVIFTWFDSYRPASGLFSLSSGSFSDSDNSVWAGSASSLTLTNTTTEAGTDPWRLQAIAVIFSDTTISNPVLSGSPMCTNYSTEWDLTNVKVTATVNNVASDYTDRFNIVVNTAIPTVTENGTMSVSVTATLKTDSSVAVTSNLTANLEFHGETTIEGLYYTEQGPLTDTYFYGIFMGYFTRTSGTYTYFDYYLANGDYGMYIYGAYSQPTASAVAPTYTPFETYLKVEGGYLSIYNNLYEVSSYVNNTNYTITTTELTDPAEKAKVGTIKTYVVTGEEAGHTSERAIQMTASRLALVEGTVKTVSGTISSTTTATVTMTLANGNDFPIYINKNVSSLDYTKLASALVVGNKVSVKGFTSIHNTDYQVVNPIDVEVAPEYTAAQFAQNLLDSTDSICQAATDTNGPLLAPIWIDLEINKWPTLSGSEKNTLVSASANEGGTVIEQAMARYDLICVRYGLTNFIGRASAYPSHYMNQMMDNNQVVIITVIMGLLATTSFAAFYMLRKKKLA